LKLWQNNTSKPHNLILQETKLQNFLKRTIMSVALVISGVSMASAFELTSPDVKEGGTIGTEFVFNNFGCTGGNVSPELDWSNPPKDTKSFAMFVHDSDAKTGGAGFWHWAVINIPASATSLAKGDGEMGKPQTKSGARQISTDFGVAGWGGPCPPAGEPPHHYAFTVYALKTEKLDLPENATSSFAGFMANMNAINKATLTATYGH
jgi:Raf kinase inhibitor-like YbhB/YbcL family protein